MYDAVWHFESTLQWETIKKCFMCWSVYSEDSILIVSHNGTNQNGSGSWWTSWANNRLFQLHYNKYKRPMLFINMYKIVHVIFQVLKSLLVRLYLHICSIISKWLLLPEDIKSNHNFTNKMDHRCFIFLHV